MAPEELPGMTEFVVLSTLLSPEVFRIPKDSAAMGGLAPSVDFLLLLEQELSIPWRPLLERRLGRRLELPLRLKQPTYNCIAPPVLNGGTSLPLDHSNSHQPVLCKPDPP
jgi:hypothetical protein